MKYLTDEQFRELKDELKQDMLYMIEKAIDDVIYDELGEQISSRLDDEDVLYDNLEKALKVVDKKKLTDIVARHIIYKIES